MVGETAVEDFCETGSGSTPPRARMSEYYGGEIPWVKSGELREGTITSTEESVTEAAVRAARLKIVPKGSLLVAMYGATVGRTAILGVDATTNQAVCHIRPDPARADTRYVWFALRAKLPELLARRVGGAQPNISQETIRTTKIRLPRLAEQLRIAEILDKADAIRRKRKEAIALSEELLRSAFLEMFGDPVSNPKGWKITRLGDLSEDLRYGTSEKCGSIETEGSLPVLRIPNVAKGAVDWADLKYARLSSAENERLLMQPGDILFVRSNGNPELIGRCAVYDSDRPALFASYLIRARIRGGLPLATYLQGVFLSLSYRHVMTAEARTTAGNYNISAESLRQLRVPVPRDTLMEKYVAIDGAVRGYSSALENAHATSDALFNSLVAHAFSGSRSRC